MYKHPPTQALGPAINRLADIMAHSNRYAFEGVKRLASDARVDPSSVSRFINRKLNPSFIFVARLTHALEEHLGIVLDPRDIVAERGEFLTRYACDLCMSCDGCLPDAAYDEFGDIKQAFRDVTPGQWSTSRYPKGYKPEKGVS